MLGETKFFYVSIMLLKFDSVKVRSVPRRIRAQHRPIKGKLDIIIRGVCFYVVKSTRFGESRV